MYVKIEKNKVKVYPYSDLQLKSDNPSVSFPDIITDELRASFGMHRVVVSDPPEVSHINRVVEANPVLISGAWMQQWKVEQLSTEELSEKTGKEWETFREKRADLLSKSDWTQGKDIPEEISVPWAEYRQKLRDIPSTGVSPFNIVWPSPPKTNPGNSETTALHMPE
jgi:hypothetical protein